MTQANFEDGIVALLKLAAAILLPGFNGDIGAALAAALRGQVRLLSPLVAGLEVHSGGRAALDRRRRAAAVRFGRTLPTRHEPVLTSMFPAWRRSLGTSSSTTSPDRVTIGSISRARAIDAFQPAKAPPTLEITSTM